MKAYIKFHRGMDAAEDFTASSIRKISSKNRRTTRQIQRGQVRMKFKNDLYKDIYEL